ncbi:hypothetical protein K491DRAFT_719349 [Lophiostoma macrostomum CBS 122681]|uniref:Uncharacterized protein n=1 Tax=Lophiostoma macrostomum CBS 122681 TaxID=1314788 RepID=A0A6A6SY81_9PLEO|nr:hypothetical protein K491DRAFT_719349 [Lophiostoma macrostomum CBS 122681]
MDGQLVRDGRESSSRSETPNVPQPKSSTSSDASLFLEMNLWLAQQKIERLETEREKMEMKTKSLCQENGEILSELQELKVPVLCVESATQTEAVKHEDSYTSLDNLSTQLKDKQLELAMTTMSLRDREQEKRRQEKREERLERYEEKIKYLESENGHLKLSLEVSREKTNEMTEEKQAEAGVKRLLEEENVQLQSLVEVLKNPAQQFQGLSTKIDGLMSQMEQDQKNEAAHVHLLKHANQKMTKKNNQLQGDLEVQKKENADSARIILTLQAENQTLRNTVEVLQQDLLTATQNSASTLAMRTQLDTVQAYVDGLQERLAMAITELDCYGAGMRILNCKHPSLNWVLDTPKSTQGKDSISIADGIFKAVGKDPQFLREYETSRRFIIQHHRAHERTGLGRAAWATRIRDHFLTVDAHSVRNIAINY